MGVAVSVAGKVGVGERDGVGVSVGVEVSAVEKVSGSFGTRKKVRPAATAITARSEPMAAGRLSVNCGMLAARTDFSVFLTALGAAGCAPNSVPHTKQRTAFSLKRVPQVGQTLVLLGDDSEVIRAGIIPSNKTTIFRRLSYE